jgi:hypothetical protein
MAAVDLCSFNHWLGIYIQLLAAVGLCTFNHGLGIYIRILSLGEKIIEYKCPTND